MQNQFSRTELIFGKKALDKLRQSHIAVFGLGGVGSYVTEALTRSGIGTLDIFDHDKITVTNLNRQLIATQNTIGKYKVDIMKERILEINSEVIVNSYPCFYLPENAYLYDFSIYDYIVDAIDTVTAKIEIILQAQKKGRPIISCMGTGNKIDPTKFEITDIYKTSICPLAKVMRKELKKRGVKELKVLYSKEKPRILVENIPEIELEKKEKRTVPGSNAFVPPVAGLIIAGEVIKDITEIN